MVSVVSSAQNPGKSAARTVFARVFGGPWVPDGSLKNGLRGQFGTKSLEIVCTGVFEGPRVLAET